MPQQLKDASTDSLKYYNCIAHEFGYKPHVIL